MKFGVALGRLNPAFFESVAVAADEFGFESVWLPEHLVFTAAMSNSPYPGAMHPPVPPETPIFDAFSYLSYLAAKTQRVRLGTHVFNIGLRHPFTTARSVQTLDIVSGGRVEFGVGASWLREEWNATQLDFASRGARVDECIEICRKLWSQSETTYHGTHFEFDGVVFEPKPIQQPGPPILIGGESNAALRRAAKLGDGWVGMGHTIESATAQVNNIQALLVEYGRDPDGFQFVCGGPVENHDDVRRWERTGITRLVVAPWTRSPDAVDGLRRFADAVL